MTRRCLALRTNPQRPVAKARARRRTAAVAVPFASLSANTSCTTAILPSTAQTGSPHDCLVAVRVGPCGSQHPSCTASRAASQPTAGTAKKAAPAGPVAALLWRSRRTTSIALRARSPRMAATAPALAPSSSATLSRAQRGTASPLQGQAPRPCSTLPVARTLMCKSSLCHRQRPLWFRLTQPLRRRPSRVMAQVWLTCSRAQP